MVCGVCCAEPILFWFPLSFLVYRVDTRDRGAAGVGASAWRSENAVSSEVPPWDVVECISTGWGPDPMALFSSGITVPEQPGALLLLLRVLFLLVSLNTNSAKLLDIKSVNTSLSFKIQPPLKNLLLIPRDE